MSATRIIDANELVTLVTTDMKVAALKVALKEMMLLVKEEGLLHDLKTECGPWPSGLCGNPWKLCPTYQYKNAAALLK